MGNVKSIISVYYNDKNSSAELKFNIHGFGETKISLVDFCRRMNLKYSIPLSEYIKRDNFYISSLIDKQVFHSKEKLLLSFNKLINELESLQEDINNYNNINNDLITLEFVEKLNSSLIE